MSHLVSSIGRIIYACIPPLKSRQQSYKRITNNAASLQTHAFSIFELNFLGSGGKTPTKHRGKPCLQLKLVGTPGTESWIFDAGEGSLRQAAIARVGPQLRFFVTNLHMDHVMGLPAFIAQASGSVSPGQKATPVMIYGPPGLYELLCVVYRLTNSISFKKHVVVHELVIGEKDIRCIEDNIESISWRKMDWNNVASKFEAVEGIECVRLRSTGDNVWSCVSDPEISVTAALVKYATPSFAYVVKETDKAGHLLKEKLAKLAIDHRIEAGALKQLKNGEDVMLSDGRRVRAADVVSAHTPGRKVAIVGHTFDASSIADMARYCDVLVHECTYDMSLEDLAIKKGHCTTADGVAMSRRCQARRLVLNHIGHTYQPHSSSSSDLQPKAMQAKFGRSDMKLFVEVSKMVGPERSQHILIARDYLTIKIPSGGYRIDNDEFAHSSSLKYIGDNANNYDTLRTLKPGGSQGVTEETSNSVMQRQDENSEGCSVDKRAVKGAPKDFVEVNNFRSTVGKRESSLPT